MFPCCGGKKSYQLSLIKSKPRGHKNGVMEFMDLILFTGLSHIVFTRTRRAFARVYFSLTSEYSGINSGFHICYCLIMSADVTGK